MACQKFLSSQELRQRDFFMNILGLTTSHSSSAALLADGSLVGMIQEERFTKRKNQVALPLRAADALVESHLGGDRRKIRSSRFRWPLGQPLRPRPLFEVFGR